MTAVLPSVATPPTHESPPSVRMVELLAGFQVSQALYAVAKLGVCTALLDGPHTADEVAASVGAQPDVVRRLLRDLAGLGVFTTPSPDRYAVTPLGATLAEGTPGSVRDLALTWMETHYAPFGLLLETARTGEPAATRYYGRPFFQWLARDPEQVARFTGAMAGLTEGIKSGAVAGYRVPGGPTIADIGGADGALLLDVLAADPQRRGIVFDLPHVVPAARARLAGHPLAGRVDVVAGDFFAAVPPADTYLLSMVLHDWDDEAAAAILANIAAAAPPGARLVGLELVVPPGDAPHLATMIDLTMLGMLTGRERTAEELTALLAAAGFRVDRITPTATPISLVEATLG
jgi:O-methyltransferase domain/Dimerisation domain